MNNSPSLKPIQDISLPQTPSLYLIAQMEASPEVTATSLRREFSRLSVDDKVAVSDLKNLAGKRAAMARAKIISDILVLDIDGNSEVSTQELMSISKEQVELWNSGSPKYLPYGQADLNNDNVITLTEMIAFSREHVPVLGYENRADYIFSINAFNSDGDEYITLDEFESGLKRIGYVKTDHDKKIAKSSRRHSPKKEAEMSIGEKKPPLACTPEPPSENDKIVFISTYNGGGYSSVTLGGQDEVTEVIRLVVESGDRPLYIMGSTFGNRIWLLEGDTKRVRRFVTSSHKFQDAKVGVSGIRKDKVEVLSKGCLEYFKGEDHSDGVLAKAKWTKILDRSPDHIVAAERLATTSVPSGRRISEIKTGIQIINGDQPPVNFDFEDGKVTLSPALENKGWGTGRFKPDGVIYVDPKSVVSSHKAVPYKILPENAGLDQLTESGHLVRLEHNAYKVVKPIPRFPASLDYLNKIILGENIPMPEGSPGSASIYSEKTGKCLVKRCR